MTIDRILIYPNMQKTIPESVFERVVARLRALGAELYTTSKAHARGDILPISPEEGFSLCDVAVTLGGDGTILSAARYAWKTGTPLLGVNFGTLGYMSELEVGECDLLANLRDAVTENRMLLDIAVCDRAGKQTDSGTALNEMMVCRSIPGRMIRLTLTCDSHTVSSYRADGMLISTPTGSSAYNLSAGGPIIDPKMNAFCASPLAPHTLSAVRPILFSPDAVLEIAAEGKAAVAADSRPLKTPEDFCLIRVRRSKAVLKLLKLKNAGFYEVLMKKMMFTDPVIHNLMSESREKNPES